MGWFFSHIVGGMLRWAIAAIIGAICLMFGFSPENWIKGVIETPPLWLIHDLTRVGFVVVGVLVIVGVFFWDRAIRHRGHRVKVGADIDTVHAHRKVVDLGAVQGHVILDLTEGDYFRATLVGHATIQISNPPPRGVVGRFDFELTNSGKYTTTWKRGFQFPAGFPNLSKRGTDVISGQTSDGGNTWRVTAVTAEFVKEAIILAREIKPSRTNGCEFFDATWQERRAQSACLRFDPTVAETGEWESVFTHVLGTVRLRFSINWSTWDCPDSLGKFGAVFRIYGPSTQYNQSDKFVRLKAEMEVTDAEKKQRRSTPQEWSEFTEEIYINSSESYFFRIDREVSAAEDTLNMDVNIHSIQIDFVGEN